MAAVSANRLELLQIADAVAREKAIDRGIVITAMEDAIAKAARSRYGSRNRRARGDRARRPAILASHPAHAGGREWSRTRQTRLRWIEAQQAPIRPHRSATRSPIPLPPLEYGRIAAQSAKQVIVQKVREAERDRQYAGVQGSHRRYRQRHRQACRIRQRRGRSRPRRGDRAPRRDCCRAKSSATATASAPISTTCGVKPRGPQIFLSRTHPQFTSKLFAQEVPEIYDGHCRGQGGCPRSGLARQDRRHFTRFLGRSGRRLRRHARFACAGGGE